MSLHSGVAAGHGEEQPITRCDIMDLYVEDRTPGYRRVPSRLRIMVRPADRGGDYAIYFRWDTGDVIRDHIAVTTPSTAR